MDLSNRVSDCLGNRPIIIPVADLTAEPFDSEADANRDVSSTLQNGAKGAWERVVPARASRGAGKPIRTFLRKLSRPFLVFERYPIARRRIVSVSARIIRFHAARMLNRSFVFTLLPPVRLRVRFDFGSPVVAYYIGLYEKSSMTFLLRYLRQDEGFVDVGANVGVYTVLAAGVAGARVRAFEPFSGAYDALVENVSLNALDDRVELHRRGIGSRNSKAFITTAHKGGNRITGAKTGEALERIDIVSLDHAVGTDVPDAIKIDVEGYEEQVLRGARRILSSRKNNVVIIEAIDRDPGCGHVDRCVSILTRFGFRLCTYDPDTNRLTECGRGARAFVGPNDENYLFVKDIEKARRRIGQAGRGMGNVREERP